MDFKFELGSKAKDKITGFTGIIIARTQWQTNCNTYGLKSQSLHEGKPMEAVWFDEPNIEIIKDKIMETKRDTGGPERTVRMTKPIMPFATKHPWRY